MSRYARQIAVAGIGPAGQAAIAAGAAAVEGAGLDARVAALYLAGAGVGALTVDPSLLDECAALNGEIALAAGAPAETFAVTAAGERLLPAGAGAVERGARGARWVLARLLGGRGTTAA